MVKEIPLQNGMFAIVDDEDYERCMEYTWWTQVCYETRLSVVTEIDDKTVQLPRFLMNPPKDKIIILENRNQLDFRKQNILFGDMNLARQRTKSKRGTSSKYKGVYWRKDRKKWCAEIKKDGKRFKLGCYDNEDEAAKTYNNKAIELFGFGNCYLNEIGKENYVETVTWEKVSQYRKSDNRSSIYKGVSWSKKRKEWDCYAQVNGETVILGRYESEVKAAEVYDKKAIELHGEKAVLNFPAVTSSADGG